MIDQSTNLSFMKTMNGLHENTGYWLRRLSDLFNSQLVDKLHQEDVSWAEWGVLVTLYRAEASSPAAIASHMGIDRAAVTRTVERLVRRKYLEREKAEDRRRTILNLTDKAKSKVPRLAKLIDENEREFFDSFSAKDMAIFKKIIGSSLRARGVQPSKEWESK